SQFRRRFGMPLPVSVTYDDFVADTEPNRVLKAALRRIQRLPLRRRETRTRLAPLLGAFDAVSDIVFSVSRLPKFHYDRMLERLRQPLELALLVLRSSAIALEHGRVETTSLLFDMNRVYEDFVFGAVGDELK